MGIFEAAWFGKVEIYIEDHIIWFKSHRSPKFKGQMLYCKANTFVMTWIDADAFVIFGLNEEGGVLNIKMKGISPLIEFSFDFQDLNLKKVNKK